MRHIPKVLIAAALGLLPHVVSAANLNLVPLKNMTYSIDGSLKPETLDDAFKLALLDSGWIPLEASPGHIVAETLVRAKHYVKIDIAYGEKEALVKLLDSRELSGACDFTGDDGNRFRGACVHANYYEWLERVVAGLPIASAKVAFIKSLNSPRPR